MRWGSDYRGPCGSHSRVVTAMLVARGVPSRLRLLLDGSGKSIHTVVEALTDGGWVVGDAAFGIAFRQRDGRPATAEYLAADTAFFRAQVDTIPGYQRDYDYDSTTLLNWQKIPVVLPALRAGLERVLGPERVARIVRPEIWMWPRLFYALVFLVLSVGLRVLGVAALAQRPGARRLASARPPVPGGFRRGVRAGWRLVGAPPDVAPDRCRPGARAPA